MGMLAGESDINPYLQQEVLSASPIRLRWMLICRAAELCDMVSQMWSQGDRDQGSQWFLRVRDILGELLDGVQDRQNPLSTPISDFYVYLLKMAVKIDRSQDVQELQVMQELLALEAETWRQVLEKVDQEKQAARAGLAKGPFILPGMAQAENTCASSSLSWEA